LTQQRQICCGWTRSYCTRAVEEKWAKIKRLARVNCYWRHVTAEVKCSYWT